MHFGLNKKKKKKTFKTQDFNLSFIAAQGDYSYSNPLEFIVEIEEVKQDETNEVKNEENIEVNEEDLKEEVEETPVESTNPAKLQAKLQIEARKKAKSEKIQALLNEVKELVDKQIKQEIDASAEAEADAKAKMENHKEINFNEVTKKLLAYEKVKTEVNHPDINNCTALHYGNFARLFKRVKIIFFFIFINIAAAISGKLEMVKLLIENGASINVQDKNLNTPFHYG